MTVLSHRMNSFTLFLCSLLNFSSFSIFVSTTYVLIFTFQPFYFSTILLFNLLSTLYILSFHRTTNTNMPAAAQRVNNALPLHPQEVPASMAVSHRRQSSSPAVMNPEKYIYPARLLQV